MIALLALAATALAAEPGEVRLGLEMGVQGDLADRASSEYASFGLGPTLAIPFHFTIAPFARLRTMVRAEVATGTDRVFWSAQIDGQPTTLHSDGHWAMAATGSGSVGVEILLPIESPVELALGMDTGIGWVGTYHSFKGPTQVLLDPEVNDLDDPNNVDPYTSQVVWRSSVDASVAVPVGERLHLTLRTGYSVAFVDTRSLQKSPAVLDAQRAAYGWNPLTVTVGIARRW